MMKAIGFKTSLPITDANSFIEFEAEKPKATGHDLLVKIKAISVNPVDFKIRQNSAKDTVLDAPKIIGWDATGIVEEVGDEVTLFKKGDAVYYAGDITRSGCNAAYQLIDERIAAKKPSSFSDAQAAAMPLTLLTAWELMFDRMRINAQQDKGKTVLIIGGAGGVGSIAIQIAKKIAGLTVIATASRPETIDWCRLQGADIIVDHKNLVEAIQAAGYKEVDYVLDFVDINGYWDAIVQLIKPQGSIGSITGAATPVALIKLKTKSASFCWEYMFTRAMYKTDDMIEQHNILYNASKLFDEGVLKTTLHKTFTGLTAGNLKAAHQLQESGKAIGKTVIVY